MHTLTNCSKGCMYSQNKERIWHIVVSNSDGISIHALAEWTGLPPKHVETIVEDLHIEGNIFRKRNGRWYPEMLPIF